MPQWFGKETDWNDVRRLGTAINVARIVGAGHDPVSLDANAATVLTVGAGDAPQELGLQEQAANTVWAGPTAGADAVPTFRALVPDDVSFLPQPVAQGDMIIADATPEWAILTTPGAAGYALVSTATTEAWDQTPTWTGKHTFTAVPAIEIDVASGDPCIIFDTQGADKFALGVDDSDSDKFKINSGATLANPSDFELDSSGNVEIGGDFNLLSGKGIIHADGVAVGQFLRANGTRYVPDTLDVADITDLAYTTPNFTLGTANAEGAADTVIRSDATILIFDVNNPTTIECDDAAVVGTAHCAARRDHQHAIVCAVAGNITPDASAAEGSATSFARSDHTHGITCAAPSANLSVSTTNAEGSATSFARSDHSHAIATSSNPGAVASILASAADGGLQLLRLGIGEDPDMNNRITMVNGGQIGQTAGPLLTFDDTANDLELTGGDFCIYSGNDIDLYSDAGSTLKGEWDSTTGDIRSGGGLYVGSVGVDPAPGYIYGLYSLLLHCDAGNSNQTYGITIDQGMEDDEILGLRSAGDVVHGMTSITDTAEYGLFQKTEAAAGGLMIIGLKDADGVAGGAIWVDGCLGEAADTTKTTAGVGIIQLRAYVKDGTGVTTPGADANLVAIKSGGDTRFIFDAEGSAHADVEWTTFQEHDDHTMLADLEAMLLHKGEPDFSEFSKYNRRALEDLGLIHYDEEAGIMLNTTKLSMLVVGAVRQAYEQMDMLSVQLKAMGGN